MEQPIREIVSKIIKVNSLLVLFALIVVAWVVVMVNATSIGLSAFSKDVLVVIMGLVVIILGLLGAFRPEALLLTSEHKYQLGLLRLGDSGSHREYRQGELPPSDRSGLLGVSTDDNDSNNL